MGQTARAERAWDLAARHPLNHHTAEIGLYLHLRIGGVADGAETNRKSNSEKSGNMHDGKRVGNRMIGIR